MLEDKELLPAVRSRCKRFGLLCYHTHRSDRSERGFPDIVAVGSGGVLFRELKSDAGRPTAEQRQWLDRLCAAGADADLWYPDDLRSGRIDDELKALRKRRFGAPPAAVREELAKSLFLLVCAGDEPAAGLHWDAGSRHVDHDLWRARAHGLLLRLFAAVLPGETDEIAGWLRRHELASPTPATIFAALRSDLTSTVTAPKRPNSDSTMTIWR